MGRPLYWASSYWVDGMLIDVGPRVTGPGLLSQLRARRVDSIWITHHHEDHVGNVGPLQAAYGVDAYASPHAAHRALTHKPLPSYRRHVWGDPLPGRILPLPKRLQTAHHSFQVQAVPGHSPGDVAFLEPSEGWAFTGDLILSPRQVITRPREDFAASLASLERVLASRPRILFTGMRVFDNAGQVLQARIAFLKQVLQDLDGLRREGLAPSRARRRLFGWETWIHYWSRGDFAKQNFVDQAYVCLDHWASRESPNLGTTNPAGA